MGPTASGKSALALELAERFGGEILCADSATVYRGMDIGTAKPSQLEQERVPHHLLDLLDPDETFNLNRFLQLARDIIARVELPFVVGGTGLYIRALLEGYTLPEAPPDEEFRQEAQRRTLADLKAELAEQDPEALQIVDLQNPRRVIRALEVIRATGSFSEHYRRNPLPYPVLKMALNPPNLRERIEARARQMVAEGLLEEVRSLAKKGYAPHIHRLRIIGYREMLAVVEGRETLENAMEDLVTSTWQFSRRQCTWLRSEKDLAWVETVDEAVGAVERFRTET
jgi:tRNA dimethylallyltransferase